MNQLPKDPMMLLSVINMKLRDFYPTIDAMCEDMSMNREELVDYLNAIGYTYDAELNRFV